MLPLKCETTRKGFPAATICFILACTAVFFGGDYLPLPRGGIVPVDLFHAVFHPFQSGPDAAASLAASFFLHANLIHLLSNMWYLRIFGVVVENVTGFIPFALSYLVCGVLSMVIQAVSNPLSPIPIVGASGAIAGVMGIHFVMAPLSRLVVWVPPIFFPKIPAFIFLALWFWIQYVNLGTTSSGGGVAWWAHAGGFGAGVLIGIAMRTGLIRTKPVGRTTSRRSERAGE